MIVQIFLYKGSTPLGGFRDYAGTLQVNSLQEVRDRLSIFLVGTASLKDVDRYHVVDVTTRAIIERGVINYAYASDGITHTSCTFSSDLNDQAFDLRLYNEVTPDGS